MAVMQNENLLTRGTEVNDRFKIIWDHMGEGAVAHELDVTMRAIRLAQDPTIDPNLVTRDYLVRQRTPSEE